MGERPRLVGFSCAGALLLTCVCAQAGDYYVSPSGDDANAGTQAAPFLTIKHGASVLVPGDTLYVRAGTYPEEFYDDVPGGSSWTQPVTLAAFAGEKPVIQPPAGSSRVFTFASAASSYIVIDGLTLDAVNVSVDAVKVTWGSATGASNHIRLIRSEVMNSPGQGILVAGETGKNGLDVSANEFIDLDVHDNGTTDFDHGFYISTAGNLVEGCRVHANAGWGIHVYNGSANDADDNVIRKNRSYDNARVGNRGIGIGIYSGSGTVAYDNLLWGNKTGIAVDYGASGAGVYNNVVYANVEGGISLGQESSGAIVKNNVVWQNGGGVDDSGTGTSVGSNLVDVDPGLTDPANHDFHPTANSATIDKGETIAVVDTDFDGVPRPQGAAYDIGAYEYCPSGCSGGTAGAAGASSGGASSGGTSSGGASGGGTSSGGTSSGGTSSGGTSSGGVSGNKGGSKGASNDDGGCGCRTSGQRRPEPLLLVGALLGLALVRRRNTCCRRATE